MKEIKNNIKLLNNEDFDKSFLEELEKKEEFCCQTNTNGACFIVMCQANCDTNQNVSESFWTKLFKSIFGESLFNNGND